MWAGDYRRFHAKIVQFGEYRDREQIHKRPQLAGLVGFIGQQSLVEWTAWLEREDSNSRIPDRTRSLREFSQIWEYQVCDPAPVALKPRLAGPVTQPKAIAIRTS